VQGTIVVTADAGRPLRKQRATLRTMDVLDCSGDFRAGDTVYVVVRGTDGGQGVVATGIVRYDAAALRLVKGRSIAADGMRNESDDPALVIAEQDLRLLWPSAQ
jgi:glutamate 5-kinase